MTNGGGTDLKPLNKIYRSQIDFKALELPLVRFGENVSKCCSYPAIKHNKQIFGCWTSACCLQSLRLLINPSAKRREL